MAEPQVTVAVVSWNTRELLARCLESLEPEARSGRAEVWVVDNASTDGSADLVRERFGWVKLVASEENLGFGRAVNLVARQTSSKWVAASNADIVLRPGALDALLATGARDPGAGAIAPRLILPDGSVQHSVFGFPTIPFVFVQSLGLYYLSRTLGDRFALPAFWEKDRARRVPWAVGAFLLVRRAAWNAVGGFDDRQWMYAEDLDLGWQLHRAGRPTRYVPQARVVHASAAATTQAWGEERIDRAQADTYAWMLRRRGAAITRTVAAINTAGAGARWVACAAAAKVRPGVYGPRRDWWWRWMQRHRSGLRPRRALEAAH